jgi:hypothetical protein
LVKKNTSREGKSESVAMVPGPYPDSFGLQKPYGSHRSRIGAWLRASSLMPTSNRGISYLFVY